MKRNSVPLLNHSITRCPWEDELQMGVLKNMRLEYSTRTECCGSRGGEWMAYKVWRTGQRGRVMGYGRGGKSPDTLSTEQCSGDDRGWIHNSRIPISRSRGSQSKAAGGRQHLIPALIWGYTSPSTSNCDQGEYDQYHRIGTDKVIIDNTILYVLIPTLILNNVNICMYDSLGISYCKILYLALDS